jgi:hypothetical protein
LDFRQTTRVKAHEDAAFGAMRETGLPLATFPAACPYTSAQLLDAAWLPA